MIGLHIFFLFGLIEPVIPTLEQDEVQRLLYAVDGRDSLGEGFAVLVENIATWDQYEDQASVVDEPFDLAEITANPTMYRGLLMVVSGMVEQQSRVAPPWDRVEEWFVRDETGTPFVLYVVGESHGTERTGMMAHARFYKTMELTGRDGHIRSFAAFVTSTHLVTERNALGVIPIPFLFIPPVALGAVVVFLLNRNRVRRTPRVRDFASHVEDVIVAAEDVATDLPDDPAEALASLHKSAEGIV